MHTWLLEPDSPGARYLAMRDALDYPSGSDELRDARLVAHTEGPIATILSKMNKNGYWVNPGAGYHPTYRGTIWAISLLAQLGASVELDERIASACTYLLNNSLTQDGRFSMNSPRAPSGNIDCLQGDMCSAMIDLGVNDPRLELAFEWLARSITGEGIAAAEDRSSAIRFYASGNCGPGFACVSNNKLPCAWGAIKTMLALSKWPTHRRTNLISRAIKQGVDFLFSTNPANADYPMGYNDKPSRNWWKFGFPVFYITDMLQNVEALVRLGFSNDLRLADAFTVIRSKQDSQGRFSLEYDYSGKTWSDFGVKNQPNKWVTIRALRVLKSVV